MRGCSDCSWPRTAWARSSRASASRSSCRRSATWKSPCLRQLERRYVEPERRFPAPVLALPGHRLDVAVPLEVERVQAELDRRAHLALGVLVASEAPDRVDLAVPVSGVLLGVQLVGGGRLAREAVVLRQGFEHAGRRAVRPAVHRLDEAPERDALERAPPLAATDDHLDRGH